MTPVITIFVRHSLDCPHLGDEFYKRCPCWKHLRWTHDGRQHRKATKQRSWRAAERIKRGIELSYETAGEPVQPNKPATILQAVETFVRDKAGQNLNAGVLKKYRRELGRFARFCEMRRRYYLADVTLPDLTDFRATWEQRYPSSRTRQKVQERIRGFFRYALNAGFIPRNPAAALSAIKVDVAPTLPLDAKQYQALLRKVPEVFSDPVKAARVRALIRCMRHTGLAIGDAVCLERAKIQHDPKKGLTRIVTSRAKTGVDVSVPIPPDVAEELLAVANGNPRYVFWQTGSGQPESAVKAWHRELRTLFDAAGLPDGHPHQLRDTAAVEWLKAGIPIEEVSRLLGHSSVRTTEKHYNPWVRSRQERLDSLVVATWKRPTPSP